MRVSLRLLESGARVPRAVLPRLRCEAELRQRRLALRARHQRLVRLRARNERLPPRSRDLVARGRGLLLYLREGRGVSD
jgi:hypothetical protein